MTRVRSWNTCRSTPVWTYCFVWLHVWQYEPGNGMGLLKADLCRGTSVGWSERSRFPVEPIFVGRPGARLEDDGLVLGPVFDSERDVSLLYVWNATDMEVLAVMESPVQVPFTIHGIWIDNVGF